eukprot:CAMPEP_0174719230 /NCGR_PEP_ID=MMETSP1094-20130205/30862_1 /TAXON_ID=156173 /ORGANISM="Chrysochromulina brevifilum, Strain UTEX LB 985" /LENGTH=194 /DNA_ID=CAMNT_0015919501 /DNA_START=56 /DNA_END=640 /DNA_ORIENTATION=-
MAAMPTAMPDQKSGMDIDMEALRMKYSRPREELVAEANAKFGPGGLSTAPAKTGGKDTTVFSKEVIICSTCQAHGTLKKQYGFRVIDEVCSACDGEGCFVKGEKKASFELRDKVAAVERLIAQCEDLDELEKLDAALQQRTMPALDAVLADARQAAIARAEAAREAASVEAAEATTGAPADEGAVSAGEGIGVQ